MESRNALIESLGRSVKSHGFRPHWRQGMTKLDCVAFWRKCTLNTNRAVAVIQGPQGEFEVGPYCQKLKWRLMWQTRFIPFLYEVGLQIVICGNGLDRAMREPKELRKYVDGISNQFVVLQSLFVVDLATRHSVGVRTWGQFLTGPIQDSIALSIRTAGFQHPGDELQGNSNH